MRKKLFFLSYSAVSFSSTAASRFANQYELFGVSNFIISLQEIYKRTIFEIAEDMLLRYEINPVFVANSVIQLELGRGS